MNTAEALVGVAVDGGYRLGRLTQTEEGLALFEAVRDADEAPLCARRIDMLVTSPTELAQLQADIGVLTRLASAMLPAPLDVVTAPDGTLVLLYPFLTGEPLARRLRRGKFGIDRSAHLLRQVARAVEAAHGAGVLHRGLSPASILIAPDGGELAHVLDFGVGRLGDDDRRQSSAGRVALQLPGPPGYLAPEQLRAGPVHVDAHSDQFALGAVLYHAIVGRAPFGGGSAAAQISRVLHAEPAPMVGVSRDVEKVVLRALAKSRDARFDSIQALIAALDGALGTGDLPPAHERLERARLATPVPVPAVSPRAGPAGLGGAGGGGGGGAGPTGATVRLPALLGDPRPRTITDRVQVPLARRPGWLLPLLGLAVAVTLALVGVGWSRGWLLAPGPATQPAAGARREVELRFAIDPPDALVWLDGVRAAARVLRVPRARTTVQLVVEAPGFVRAARALVPDVDQDVVIRLERQPAPSPAAPPADDDAYRQKAKRDLRDPFRR